MRSCFAVGDQWSVSKDGDEKVDYGSRCVIEQHCRKQTHEALNYIEHSADAGVVNGMINRFCMMYVTDESYFDILLRQICLPLLREMCIVVRQHCHRNEIAMSQREIMCYGVCALLFGLRTIFFVPIRSDDHSKEIGVTQALHEFRVKDVYDRTIFNLAVTKDYSTMMENLVSDIGTLPHSTSDDCNPAVDRIFRTFMSVCIVGTELRLC